MASKKPYYVDEGIWDQEPTVVQLRSIRLDAPNIIFAALNHKQLATSSKGVDIGNERKIPDVVVNAAGPGFTFRYPNTWKDTAFFSAPIYYAGNDVAVCENPLWEACKSIIDHLLLAAGGPVLVVPHCKNTAHRGMVPGMYCSCFCFVYLYVNNFIFVYLFLYMFVCCRLSGAFG